MYAIHKDLLTKLMAIFLLKPVELSLSLPVWAFLGSEAACGLVECEANYLDPRHRILDPIGQFSRLPSRRRFATSWNTTPSSVRSPSVRDWKFTHKTRVLLFVTETSINLVLVDRGCIV